MVVGIEFRRRPDGQEASACLNVFQHGTFLSGDLVLR
jgi:hypothetical protein